MINVGVRSTIIFYPYVGLRAHDKSNGKWKTEYETITSLKYSFYVLKRKQRQFTYVDGKCLTVHIIGSELYEILHMTCEVVWIAFHVFMGFQPRNCHQCKRFLDLIQFALLMLISTGHTDDTDSFYRLSYSNHQIIKQLACVKVQQSRCGITQYVAEGNLLL